MNIKKNRNREWYSFANINLLGSCNADCYFCLGKDLSEELRGQNQLSEHFDTWKNFDYFLAQCNKHNIKKLYITGQTADGLQYHFLEELVDTLQDNGFVVGVRTNGYLAEHRMHIIRKMRGEIGYSIHSLCPETNKTIMGRARIPNWNTIIPASGHNVRISIVLNRHNISELADLLKFCSTFPNVRYIQIRRISTDTRIETLQEDIDIYEAFYKGFSISHQQQGSFCLGQQYSILGKEVIFWRTVETSCNSLNYFTDGTCSDEYFIVEGYLKYKDNK